jgi:hypothetical protein
MPFKYPEPKKKFERFQGIKVFYGDKSFGVSGYEFLKRCRSRPGLTNNQNFERFKDNYRTILNWLCVSYNENELSWQNLKRDHENNRLDCYEVRWEEIINTCMSIDKKYWRTQCTISSRRRT